MLSDVFVASSFRKVFYYRYIGKLSFDQHIQHMTSFSFEIIFFVVKENQVAREIEVPKG